MESTRDIRRMIDREIKKGSAPLVFDHLEYKRDSLNEITSEQKLKEVLTYLLRVGEFEGLASKMTRNNVYSENHLMRGESFHRHNNALERNANYLNILNYAKRLSPIYDGKTYIESVPCYLSIAEAELERYKFVYEGKETYAFPLSAKHIQNGLYLLSIMSRKELSNHEVPEFVEDSAWEQIYHLRNIRAVLFQCLLLDDIHPVDGLFETKLNTIYLL